MKVYAVVKDGDYYSSYEVVVLFKTKHLAEQFVENTPQLVGLSIEEHELIM